MLTEIATAHTSTRNIMSLPIFYWLAHFVMKTMILPVIISRANSLPVTTLIATFLCEALSQLASGAGCSAIYYSQVLTNVVNGTLVETGTIANDDELARQFGIKELEEETSESISFGLIKRFDNGFDLTMDAYQINIDDRIVLSETLTADVGAEFGDILADNNLGAAQFFTNSVDTKTTGLDVIASYPTELMEGELNLTAAMSFMNTEVERVNSVSSLIDGDDIFNDTQILAFGRRSAQ